jgi:hypothetical protein
MTKTTSKVTRVTTGAYAQNTGLTGRGYGKARPIAVTILPGDTLVLRPLRTKRSEYVSIEQVWRWAVASRVRSEAAQKLNAKRRAKRG